MSLDQLVDELVQAKAIGFIDAAKLLQRLIFLDAFHYNKYEQFRVGRPPFLSHLTRWLTNVAQPEQRALLLEIAANLFVIADEEETVLCRHTIAERVEPWLIRISGIMLDDASFANRVDRALKATWFLGATDSMQLNSFAHIAGKSGIPERRTVRQDIETPGAQARYAETISKYRVQAVVLLEDWVGSGSQIKDCVDFLLSIPSLPPLLVSPLFAASAGVSALKENYAAYGDAICFDAGMTLRSDAFVSRNPYDDEDDLTRRIRSLVKATFGRHPRPFGFEDIGGLVVLPRNCPNNSLPLIHCETEPWRPLFPRAPRRAS